MGIPRVPENPQHGGCGGGVTGPLRAILQRHFLFKESMKLGLQQTIRPKQRPHVIDTSGSWPFSHFLHAPSDSKFPFCMQFVNFSLGCRRGHAGRVPSAGTRCFSELSVPSLVTAELIQVELLWDRPFWSMQDAFIRLAGDV